MNTPNPLVPQGSLLQPGAKSKSKLALLVLGILAFHAVFILGILVQGCKREDTKKVETTPPPALPPLPTEPYTRYSELPTPTNPTPTGQVSSLPTTPPAPVVAPVPSEPAPIAAPMPPEVPAAGASEYTIAKGDSFYSIGKKRGIPYSAIAKANPGVDSSRLKVGQKIQLPAAAAAGSPTGSPTAAAASVAETGNGSATYTVKAGDTLTKIARSHGTTVAALRAGNKLRTDRINVGQKLKVPAAKAAEAPAAPAVEAPLPTPSALPTPPSSTPVPPGTPPAR